MRLVYECYLRFEGSVKRAGSRGLNPKAH